jgi:hypothetical protein
MPHLCHIDWVDINITNALSPKEIANADQKTPKLGNG